MTLKLRILRSLTRLFIILVSLTRSLFIEKMLISNRCISGLMSNLIKKSWTVSSTYTSLEVHSMYYIAQSEGRSLCNVQCKSKGKTDAAKLSYNKSKDLCKPLHTLGFHEFPYFELKVISTKTVESNSYPSRSTNMPFSLFEIVVFLIN